MISFNNKTKYPQIIVCKEKYDDKYYIANNEDELLDISLDILKDWAENGNLEHLRDTRMPEVDLLNSESAALKPWLYSPYTKLDDVLLNIDFVKDYKEGKTPDMLKKLFDNDEKSKEKLDNVTFWRKRVMNIINKYDDGEYMNVYMVIPQKIN